MHKKGDCGCGKMRKATPKKKTGGIKLLNRRGKKKK